MFYIVCDYKDSMFVYDDMDSSCELVEKSVLSASGVVTKKMDLVYNDLNKLAVLYNLDKSIISGFQKELVSYDVNLKADYNIYYVRLGLGIRLIPLEDLCVYGFKYKESNCKVYAIIMCHYLLEYSSSLRARGAEIKIPDNSYLTSYAYYHLDGKLKGIQIPLPMLDYTLRLAKMHDLDGIFRAYNGIFDKKIVYQLNFDDKILNLKMSEIINIKWSI